MILARPAEAPAGVIERWQPELERIAPRDGSPTWLKLVWVPGYPWQPVERWFIYQMVPLRYLAGGITEAVVDYLRNGPDPANLVGFDSVRRKIIAHAGIRPVVDRFQYAIYKETDHFAQPLWVCQGFNGGHKRKFDDVESNISEMNGGPAEPPAPGDLCYAEPDMRTISKLKDLDLVERYKGCIRFDERSPEELDREEREKVEAMRGQLWNWLGSQVAEMCTFSNAQLGQIKDNAHRGAEPDYEQIEENFITG